MDATSAAVRSAAHHWLIDGSEQWQPLTWDSLDAVRVAALQLLVSSRLVERRDTLDAWWDSTPDPPRSVVSVVTTGDGDSGKIVKEISEGIPGWAGRIIKAQRRPSCDWRLTMLGLHQREDIISLLTSDSVTASRQAAMEEQVLTPQPGRFSVRLRSVSESVTPPATVAYQPNDAEQAILEMLRARGRRLVTDDVLGEMAERGHRHGVKERLAVLVRAQLLTNTIDARGKGYGLREWSQV